jgi:acyl-CoA thioesterase FadM
MNLLGRVLWLLLSFKFRGKVGYFEEVRTGFRVWPSDLDTNLHMNNGVYLSIMDLGRTDLVLRSGLMRVVKERGWYPVVASQAIRYRRSLDPFKRFEVHTRVLGWDDRFFFIQQKFMLAGEVAALAVVKGRFLKKSGGGVNPGDIAVAMGQHALSPELPAWVNEWAASEDAAWKSVVG